MRPVGKIKQPQKVEAALRQMRKWSELSARCVPNINSREQQIEIALHVLGELLPFRDPQAIARMVRSSEPCEARDRIAEIFEGKSDTLKVLTVRRAGNPSDGNWWPAILMLEVKRQHPDWKQKQVVGEVCDLLNLKRTQVLDHWKKHKQLIESHSSTDSVNETR